MITVAGLTPSLDLTYLVPRLALGEIHRTSQVVRCAGGKALNMARAASTVGGAMQVVAILGGDTGRTLTDMLQTEGLPVVAVPSPLETRTCVSIAAADTGRLTEVYQDADALPPDVWAGFRTALETALHGTSGWLSISGRAPASSAGGIADLVSLGHDFGVRVAVDTHGDALPGAVAARPDLVKVNRYEAAELLDVAPDTDLLDMAAAIRSRTGALVVLTDGAAGSLAVDGEVALTAQAPDLVGRYPVGSGDSFLGGLLAAVDRGAHLDEALRVATACGVANAQVPGQGHFPAASAAGIVPQVLVRPARAS